LVNFCVLLVYFVVKFYILCPFDIGILWPVGLFCGKLVYFSPFGYILPVLVCCTKKNMALFEKTLT
jgi:hypothetical protein